MAGYPLPKVWDQVELAADRRRGTELFVENRKEEGPRAFSALCTELRPRVEGVFRATENLLAFDGSLFRADPMAWEVARYLCAPPISEEDLWTYVGPSKFKRVPPAYADDTAQALSPVLDPVRFPWLAEQRAPTDSELSAALLSTTTLWATQQLATRRRGAISRRQEAATAVVLEQAGLHFEPSRTRVDMLDEMTRGTFSRERVVAGAKCDVPVRLPDGRMLMIECKVSNGPKNGWKRVNREVVGKAEHWRAHFGVHAITAVVLSGVFDQSCLATAQSAGVFVLWEHHLQPLSDFLSELSY